MSELIKYVNGEVRPAREDKAVAKQSKAVYDETRVAAFKAEASFALAGHIMQKLAELDGIRVAIAGNDPIMNDLLIGIETQAIQKAKAIHGGLFNGWHL